MSIARERFELALQRLTFPEWSRFEALSSAFLASEYGELRTMAAPSGDGGRDSQLYHADGELDLAFQYSVTGEWEAKIKHTVKRLKEEFGSVNQLVYMSSRVIGAKADKLRKELRLQGISLDIRDASWFLERANLDNNRSSAAESLSKVMVDPLLAEKGLISNSVVSLSGDEAKTALMYLEMQREDEVRGKNLTRSSFESLVKAALRGTDRDNRLPIEELYRRVGAFLPRHGVAQLKPFVDGAIIRLKRDAISEWGAGKEYHLRFEEAERIKDRAAKLLVMRSAFDADLMDVLSSSPSTSINDTDQFVSCVHAVVEKYFLQRGEEFAHSVNGDADIGLNDYDLRQAISTSFPVGVVGGRNQSDFVFTTIVSLLNTPSDATRKYLRVLSDSYTLFSFLSETPDVQKATNKLFSQGEIWVDASVLLPVIAETSAPSDLRPFTSLFQQLKRASAKLYVTPGVIEEVRSHLEISLNRARSTQWIGKIPYVYARYILYGGKPGAFASWLENFVGSYDPSRDLTEYFERMGIHLENPSDDAGVPEEVRLSVSNYWQEVQSRRRREQGTFNASAHKLARHDSENCLTVIADRLARANKSGLGHNSWWFTLDTAAYGMKSALPADIWRQIKYSPVISLDYLMKYLAFGPARDKISQNETSASRIFAPAVLDSVPNEVVEIAEKVRDQHQGLPENLVQRRIRDTLDRQREQIGELHQAGLDGFDPTLLV